MQRVDANFARFVWPTGGKKWKVRLASDGLGRPSVQDFTFDGGWAELWEDQYQPLAKTPEPYESFAELGRQVREIGMLNEAVADGLFPRTIRVNGEIVDPEPLDDLGLVLFAAGELRVQKAALAFLRKWGPPWFPPILDEGIRIPASSMLLEAVRLHHATLLVREEAESPSEDLGESRLGPIFARYLQGVRTNGYRFGCDHLLGAMWLELNEQRQGDGAWQECKGCRRLFLAEHARRLFHDDQCRYRWQRQKAKASKEAGDE